MFSHHDYWILEAYSRACRKSRRMPEPGPTVMIASQNLLEAFRAGQDCPEGVPLDWWQREKSRYDMFETGV